MRTARGQNNNPPPPPVVCKKTKVLGTPWPTPAPAPPATALFALETRRHNRPPFFTDVEITMSVWSQTDPPEQAYAITINATPVDAPDARNNNRTTIRATLPLGTSNYLLAAAKDGIGVASVTVPPIPPT